MKRIYFKNIRRGLGFGVIFILVIVLIYLFVSYFNSVSKTHRDEEIDKNFNDTEVDILPQCVNLIQVRNSMIYPQAAIEAGIEGKVIVRVLVGTDGKVRRTESISGPEIFYDEVTQKAKNLEFTPGLMSNKPVNVWVNVPFNFKLK
jgi:TonB family protein